MKLELFFKDGCVQRHTAYLIKHSRKMFSNTLMFTLFNQGGSLEFEKEPFKVIVLEVSALNDFIVHVSEETK